MSRREAVEVENLACECSVRHDALDLGKTRAAPYRRHHLVGTGSRAQAREERLPDGGDINRPNPWVDPEAHQRVTFGGLPFDQLVVGRAASEAARQHLFQDPCLLYTSDAAD